MAKTNIDVVAENLAELLTNTVDMASVFYDIFLNPNPMIIHLKAFDDNNKLIEVAIPNRAMDRITPYTGEGSPEGKVSAAIGSVYVDTLFSTVYYKVSGSAEDTYGWNAVISQSSMETFIRTYLEARGYITTSSLRTYLVTHEYVDVPYLRSYLTANGYIRGGDLPTVPEANLDDKVVIVDGDSEEVQGIAVGNLIASMISNEAGNSLIRGEDNKLYVDDGVTGVVAGTYVYPKNLVVNDGGRITSVEQGSQADVTVATDVNYGVVRPDNSTIVVNDGVISSVARNVGEIISSTIPLVDGGLHLLDGSLIRGGGIYSDFVNYIAELYNPESQNSGDDVSPGVDTSRPGIVEVDDIPDDPVSSSGRSSSSGSHPEYFCTEEEWEQAVETYGVCGKFVYDSVNNTVRLPKITGFIEGTTDASALGDLIEAGLPNIVGNLRVTTVSGDPMLIQSSYGAFSNTGDIQGTTGGHIATTSNNYYQMVYFDASEANSTYGNSNTVQPQAIKVFYYIVLANIVKPDITVDIDRVATDLDNKMYRDFENAVFPSDFASRLNAIGIRTVVETYSSGTSWYRIWSDGWCEQGGSKYHSSATTTQIALHKSYKNTNYNISIATDANMSDHIIYITNINNQNFTCYWTKGTLYWSARGYIS